MRWRLILALFTCLLMLVGTLGPLGSMGEVVEPTTGWYVEALDDVNNPTRPSIAIDSQDVVHVAYNDEVNDCVRYATWDGVQWTDECLRTDDLGPLYTSIAVDSKDRPHIAYTYWDSNFDSWLVYATKTGSTWSYRAVDNRRQVGDHSISIAVDGKDQAHISYQDESTSRLRYAMWTGNRFDVEEVDWRPGTGIATSITVDDADHPHIGYYDSDGLTLKYAIHDGNEWTVSTVDSAQGAGSSLSIAISSLGIPCIAYSTLDDGLKYTRHVEGSWQFQVIDEGDGNTPSLAFDSQDRARICYIIDRGAAIMYTKWLGTSWKNETLPIETDITWTTGIAVDSSDLAHVVVDDINGNRVLYGREVPNNPPDKPSTPAGPAIGLPGASHTYSTTTIDLDGDPIMFVIDWGDGTTTSTGYLASGSTVNAAHTWNVVGRYQVKASAMDDEGGESGWSDELSVLIDTAPDAPSVPDGPTIGAVNVTYTFTTSAIDPDGDQVRIVFDWDEPIAGQDSTVQTETEYHGSGEPVSASYQWSAAGFYYVRTKAIDPWGLESDWSAPLEVRITNPPVTPEMPQGPDYLEVGDQGGFSASTTDPDGDMIKYVFMWGTTSAIGSEPSATETGYMESGNQGTVVITWTEAGSYYLMVKAVDLYGAESDYSEKLNVEINTPPDIPGTPEGETRGEVDVEYSFAAATNDSDGDLIKYVFDFGEDKGSPTPFCETDYYASGAPVTVPNTWKEPGTYVVKVRAVDHKGGESEWSEPLVVVVVEEDSLSSSLWVLPVIVAVVIGVAIVVEVLRARAGEPE
jgi:hypothetical protein